MELEQRLHEVLERRSPQDGFAARVMAQVHKAPVIDIHTRTRKRGRFIVLGALLAVGAAAAMLGLQLSDAPVQILEEAGKSQSGMGKSPGMAEPSTSDSPETTELAKSADLFVARTSSASQGVDSPSPAPGRITIKVLPAEDESGDPLSWSAMESFRSALMADLRRRPDVLLLEPTFTASTEVAKVDYELTVTSLKWKRFPSGAVEIPTTTGRTSSQSGAQPLPGLGSEYWPVEAKFQEIQHAEPGSPKGLSYSLQILVGGNGAPHGNQVFCTGGGSLRLTAVDLGTLIKACGSTTLIAAGVVNVMHELAQDPALARQRTVQQAVEKLRNPSLSEMERYNTLLNLTRSAEGTVLDDASIRAIVDSLAGLPPARRPQQWSLLRSMKDPRLLQPQIDAMLHDPDEEVRLAVLFNLAANYGGDERTRAAMELAARIDSRQIVRVAADSMLHGDEEWSGFVRATLLDSSLTMHERLQPLTITGRIVLSQSQIKAVESTLKEAEVSGAIVAMLWERKSGLSPQDASYALGMLQGVDSPEVVDLLLDLMKAGTTQGSVMDMDLASRAIQMMSSRSSDPRFREALEAIVAGKGNSGLRFQAERQLSRMQQ